MRHRAAREEVLQTCLALAARGFLAGTGGNVALRADDEHLAITPSAVDYHAMSASDVCLVRADDLKPVDGGRSPSVETGLHAAVLASRPESRACIHTHQPIASGYGLLGMPLQVRNPEARGTLGDVVPVVAYAPSGTRRLARSVAAAIRPPAHACLMRNHGSVTVGASMEEAITRVVALESECASFFRERIGPASQGLDPSAQSLLEETLSSAIRGGAA